MPLSHAHDFLLDETASLRDVMRSLDLHGHKAVVLVSRSRQLSGLMTDGDVRRALLAGAALDEVALPYASAEPTVVRAGSHRGHVLDLMRGLAIEQIPVVDESGRVVGLQTLRDVVGAPLLPNAAVVMAGGRGSRLGALTQKTPKPLMRVAGRPIIEWIILNLVSSGIRDIYVSVNYLADQIEDHLGDGTRLGCTIRYLREESHSPLGTAGSLSILREEGRPQHAIVVMNGDLMVQFDVGDLVQAHAERSPAVTVVTRQYRHEVPFGVVERLPDQRVGALSEKPVIDLEVNAGIYVVSPEALELVPPSTPSTMPELIERCIDKGWTVSAWTLSSDWIDVGTPRDLAKAQGEV
ncbi:MAG TPA: nucleotidyltransferase family protein [Blastococcus sp.]|jgi:dTDP-glucose pyrophosphorylase|nr:nucleotidyltransferase family protein [Blastococcus sp.]